MTEQELAELLRPYAGDERMKSLFLWGAWTDGVESPCECCGTPIAVLELSNAQDFPTAHKRWVEIIDISDYIHGRKVAVYCGVVPDLAFIAHTPERCKQLRHGGSYVAIH